MPDSPDTTNQPRRFDAVLGGQSAEPRSAAVLGGLAGIQHQLSSPDPQQRIAALPRALHYGQDGLELVKAALHDRHVAVQQAAYDLLRNDGDPQIQQLLYPYAIALAKRQLASESDEQRAAALSDVLNYGHEGLNLVIHALRHSSDQVQSVAYNLLKDRTEPRVRKALELFSSTGVNYHYLRNLLISHKWQLADQETARLMAKACGPGRFTELKPSQIDDIPCEDLQIIDRLWMRHSKGKFGFTVQRSLWQQLDNLYWNKSDVWSTFGDRVGWRINHLLNPNHWKRYDELTFDRSAPVGHLPFLGDLFGIFTVETLVKRLDGCSENES
jgi:hypothetical protein